MFELADSDYKVFVEKLVPDTNDIIGVRNPMLRKLARQIAKDDYTGFLSHQGFEYYEETMLRGMVIGLLKLDFQELSKHIYNHVPKVSNWALCDSFCSSLKQTKKYPSEMWQLICDYTKSIKTYDVRFAVVMMLSYYVDEEHIDDLFIIFDNIKSEDYYVKMAIAWAISACYVKIPERTFAYLKNNSLDIFTYNKTLQKICESLRVNKETKDIIRSMKRK